MSSVIIVLLLISPFKSFNTCFKYLDTSMLGVCVRACSVISDSLQPHGL